MISASRVARLTSPRRKRPLLATTRRWNPLFARRWVLRVQSLKPPKKVLAEFWCEWRQPFDHAVALDDIQNPRIAFLGVAQERAEFNQCGTGAEVHRS